MAGVLADKISSKLGPEMSAFVTLAARLADEKKARIAIVGGAVRDLFLDWPVGDVDIMLEHPAKPMVAELAKMLNVEMVSHERFFTFSLVLSSGKKIDIVTAREETYPAPAKLPKVTPSSIENDLKRRDFTINAVATWLNKASFGDVADPFGGQEDMVMKKIRALHDKSFVDDPTRIFRAARFAGRLGFRIEPGTEKWILAAIKAGAPKLLSPVRLRHEFELIMKENSPAAALSILKGWNALEFIHSGWRGVDLASFKKPKGELPDRLAAWFKPFGKATAERMMTDLSFEKRMKAEVLSKLVQSPSTS